MSNTYKEKSLGLSKEYFENGNLKSKINWVEGKLDGVHEEYFGNGQLRFKSCRYKGKLHGKLEQYNEDGSVLKIENYKDGNLIKNVL